MFLKKRKSSCLAYLPRQSSSSEGSSWRRGRQCWSGVSAYLAERRLSQLDSRRRVFTSSSLIPIIIYKGGACGLLVLILITKAGRSMINGNSYDALTNNGIHQLFGEHFEGQQFILQVLQVLPSLDPLSSALLLSDGHAWIKGEVVGEAKSFVSRFGDLKNHLVLKFLAEDIEMLERHEFRLNRIRELNQKVHNTIGEPIAYADYLKKGCVNATGSNKISDSGCISISKVKTMACGRIKAGIKAMVKRRPERVNSVMNIIIEDELGEQIQVCIFGSSVEKFKDVLAEGSWYKFEDTQLQINNRNKELELKITNASIVSKDKQEKLAASQPGIINSNNRPRFVKPEYPKPEPKVQENITQFDITESLARGSVDNNFNCMIIARVLNGGLLKNGLGKSYNCVNKQGEMFEVMLWNDCQAIVDIGQTYKFDYMKAKLYKGKLSLQSQRNSTRITVSDSKIKSKNEISGKDPSLNDKPDNKQWSKGKLLGTNDIVYSIAEILESANNSSERVSYKAVAGFLVISFDKDSSFDYLNDVKKKLFYVRCEKCLNNEYVKSKIDAQVIKGSVICTNCKSSEQINVMWNVKVNLIDHENVLACKLNSEVAEKLIGKSPTQGIIMFYENPDSLKNLIREKVHFTQGIFKFSIKINEKKSEERFYNICEFFIDVDKIFLDRSVKELKKTEEIFLKYYNWPDKILDRIEKPIPKFLQNKKLVSANSNDDMEIQVV